MTKTYKYKLPNGEIIEHPELEIYPFGYEVKHNGKIYERKGCCDGADKNCPRFFNNGNCDEYCKYAVEYVQVYHD